MKAIPLFILLSLYLLPTYSQTAPSHLKYFGYALVDALYDDPLDASTTTNYIAEVDSFSNVAQLAVYDYTDDINARVNLLNAHCVKPFLSIQSIFYYRIDGNAPSGNHLTLYSNFQARWNSFKATNLAVLNPSKIAALYVADEPVWNGISFSDLNTVCQILKNDFPNIPTMFVEAYPVLNSLVIPTSIDWIGFDRYGIFDPATSSVFLNDLQTLKSKRSTINQKIFLIIDDQWLPYYGAAGYSADTMQYVVQNYYTLATSDTSVVGLIGYLWPGGFDDPGQLGVRDMPQSVINKNIEIGKMIKANNSLCAITTSIETINPAKDFFNIYPNPSSEFLTIEMTGIKMKEKFQIYNSIGVLIKEVDMSQASQINISNLPNGVYFIRLKKYPQQTQRFIKQ